MSEIYYFSNQNFEFEISLRKIYDYGLYTNYLYLVIENKTSRERWTSGCVSCVNEDMNEEEPMFEALSSTRVFNLILKYQEEKNIEHDYKIIFPDILIDNVNPEIKIVAQYKCFDTQMEKVYRIPMLYKLTQKQIV